MSADRSPPLSGYATGPYNVTRIYYSLRYWKWTMTCHTEMCTLPLPRAFCALRYDWFSQHHFYFSIIHLQSALHMRVRKVSRICIGSFPKFRQVIFWFSTYLFRIFMIFCPINLCYPANKQTNKQTAMKTVSPAKSGGSKYVTMPMINRETIC